MPLAAFPKCFLDQLVETRTMSAAQWIDFASSLPIDGLEFYSGFSPMEDASGLDALRARAEAAGLSIPMMCHSPDFTKPSAEERREEVELQKLAIRACARLGGRYCRVLSGQRRPEVPEEVGIGWAAECIRECLPFAAELDVTLVLENHYKDGSWLYPELVQKKEAFFALLDAVGEHPNFGVNYDPSNAIVAGDDPIELLACLKQRIVTMHASDRSLAVGKTLDDLRSYENDPLRGYAPFLHHGIVGKGLNDYDRIFSILRSVGFKGWISIEDGQDPSVGMEHLRLSAEFLRGKMAEHGVG